MKFQEEFQKRDKEFAIVTFHNTQVTDAEKMEGILEDLKGSIWGKPLPFPVLLDSSGDTISKLGINSYPTLLVVDPEGNLVKHGGEHTVRTSLMKTDSKVKSLLKKLTKAGGDPKKLAKAIKAVSKKGGDAAAFALSHWLHEEVEDPAAAHVDAVHAALIKNDSRYAQGFFWGKYGLRSEDPKRRLAAAEAIREFGTREMLWGLSDMANKEQDESVKKALQETLKAIDERTR